MKPFTTTMVAIGTAAAGFASGWFTNDDFATWEIPKRSAAALATVPAGGAPVDSASEFGELATVDDCRRFLRNVKQRFAGRHPMMRGAARDFALRRWLEIDAESALQEAEGNPGHEFSSEGFAADLFRVWMDLNVESAVGAWQQANPLLARNVRTAFLATLADKDPARAFSVWRSSRGGSDNAWDPAEEAILRRWAQQDPRTAAQKAEGTRAREAVLDEWAKTNPAEALAFWRLNGVPDMDRAGLNTALLPMLLQSDPATAKELLSLAGGSLQGIARRWTERDPAGALNWAQSQPKDAPLVSETLTSAAQSMASSDPERALQILDSLPASRSSTGSSIFARLPGSEAMEARVYVFAALVANDPERARELVLNQPQAMRTSAMTGFLRGAFAEDPNAAIEQCRVWMAIPGMKDETLTATLDAIGFDRATDPTVIIAALPELADRMDSGALMRWAESNPASAAEFVAQQVEAGRPVERVGRQVVVASIAVAGPEWTASWLQRLPDVELRTEAANTLAANWGAFDPEGAARWVNSLTTGSVRDAAIAGFRRSHALSGSE